MCLDDEVTNIRRQWTGWRLFEIFRKRWIGIIGISQGGHWLCGDVASPEIEEKLNRMNFKTTKGPLVSIAMATYNGERFLKKQLDSIFAQTYRNFELIVTNDRSTDSTKKILEEYLRMHPDMRCYTNEKKLGFTRNFERALSYCKGDYIAFADQDDIWLPEKIETFVGEIGNYSLITSDLSYINGNDEIIHPSYIQALNLPASSPEKHRISLCFKCFPLGCAMMFKAELLKKALPIPDYVEGHDWWIALVAVRENGIKFIDKKLTLYRRHGSQISEYVHDKTEFHKISKFFGTEERKKWAFGREKLLSLLKRHSRMDLELNENEKTALSESIFYIECFLNSKFDLKFFKYGYKYREHLFSKEYYFWFESLGYLYGVLIKALTGKTTYMP